MRKLLAFIAVAVGLAIGVPTTSSAGGWVVVSLDSAPVAHAGEDVEVGFTVLRHGVDAGELERSRRRAHRTRRQDAPLRGGPAGRRRPPRRHDHAAGCRRLLAGTSTGQFVAADLGTLEVTAPPSGATTWTWDVVQWGSATLALLMVGFVVLEYRKARRDRRTAPLPA